MRILLASALMSTAAFAQQNPTDVTAELFSPNLAQNWQVQPLGATPEQQSQLVFRWAAEPTGIRMRGLEGSKQVTGKQSRSTVGQGND